MISSIKHLLCFRSLLNSARSAPSRRLNHSSAADLFVPTTGRWLWNEQRKRQEHTQRFNLRALKDAVLKVADPGAGNGRVRLDKLAEGGWNKVYLARTGNQRLIVKIPDPVVQARLVTASEVATLDFLRDELQLPVPRVFDWSDSSDNPIGCEYIVMEEAQGSALNTIWDDIDVSKKVVVVEEILAIQKRLITASNAFDGFGSLYFSKDTARLGISQSLPVESTRAQRYCIGPLAHQKLTESSRFGLDHGPCKF
jgi:hypothetical protein